VWLENRRNTMNGIWYAKMNENKDIIMKDSTNNWEIKFYNITNDRFDWKWWQKEYYPNKYNYNRNFWLA